MGHVQWARFNVQSWFNECLAFRALVHKRRRGVISLLLKVLLFLFFYKGWRVLDTEFFWNFAFGAGLGKKTWWCKIQHDWNIPWVLFYDFTLLKTGRNSLAVSANNGILQSAGIAGGPCGGRKSTGSRRSTVYRYQGEQREPHHPRRAKRGPCRRVNMLVIITQPKIRTFLLNNPQRLLSEISFSNILAHLPSGHHRVPSQQHNNKLKWMICSAPLPANVSYTSQPLHSTQRQCCAGQRCIGISFTHLYIPFIHVSQSLSHITYEWETLQITRLVLTAPKRSQWRVTWKSMCATRI